MKANLLLKKLLIALTMTATLLLTTNCPKSEGPDTSLLMLGLLASSNPVAPTPTDSITAPSTPIGLTSTTGDTQATLSWIAVSGATSYKVYGSTASGVTIDSSNLKESPTTTSVTITGLTNGTTYYYKVTAVNSIGESTASDEVSVTPAAVPTAVPSAPTGLTAIGGNTSATLSWTAVSGAISYKVYRATYYSFTVSTSTYQGNSTVTSYTSTGLTNGTTYYFKVVAVNSVGDSAASSAAGAIPAAPTTPATTPATAPTISASAGQNSVSLTIGSVTGATSYKIYYATTDSVTTSSTSVTSSSTSYTVTGLTVGTTYYFKASAVNSAGEGPLTATAVSATPTGWQNATLSTTTTNQFNAVRYLGPTLGFWAVSQNAAAASAKVYKSTDGITWNPVTLGCTPASGYLKDIAADSSNNILIVGWNGTIIYSAGGADSSFTCSTITGTGTRFFERIEWRLTDGFWVAGQIHDGVNYKLLVANAPLYNSGTWTMLTSNNAVTFLDFFRDLTLTTTGVYAAGENGYFGKCDSGCTLGTNWTINYTPDFLDYNSIEYFGGSYYMFGSNSLNKTSSFVTTTLNSGVYFSGYGVGLFNSKLYAVGYYIYTSTDGSNWTSESKPTTESMYDVTCSSTVCAAAGANGSIIYKTL